MAMMVGLDNILNQDLVKMQKTLVICYPLIDYLLLQMDKEYANIGDLTRTTDCLLYNDTHALQNCLTQFLEVADTLYSFLLIKGKVVVASREWWALTNQERSLLCCYVNSLPKVLSREIVVYLPTSSPNTPNRLITLNLLKDIEVCVLCSSEPLLAVLEDQAPKIWACCFDLLKSLTNLHPRNFPTSIELDSNIEYLLLINTKTGQSLCSSLVSSSEASTSKSSSSSPGIQRQQESLRCLYKLVGGTYFEGADPKMDANLKADNTCSIFDYGVLKEDCCEALEYSMSLGHSKCNALKEEHFQIYIFFKKDIPDFAIRSITHKTLQKLTAKKLFPPV